MVTRVCEHNKVKYLGQVPCTGRKVCLICGDEVPAYMNGSPRPKRLESFKDMLIEKVSRGAMTAEDAFEAYEEEYLRSPDGIMLQDGR